MKDFKKNGDDRLETKDNVDAALSAPNGASNNHVKVDDVPFSGMPR